MSIGDLHFSQANAKLEKLYKIKELKPYLLPKRKIYSFDLTAGKSCPQALECHSFAVETKDGLRIKDGKHTKWRCYAASNEVIYQTAYRLRKRNLETLTKSLSLGVDKLSELISNSLPKNAGIIRIHSSGDFFVKNYFESWLKVIKENPNILFYAYTKQIKFWVDYKQEIDNLPNFVLTASYGGRQDEYIDKNNLRSVKVVYSKKQAKDLGLKLDKDDSFAANPKLKNNSFALLIHGPMPKGSEAGKAMQLLKKKGIFGYGRKLKNKKTQIPH